MSRNTKRESSLFGTGCLICKKPCDNKKSKIVLLSCEGCKGQYHPKCTGTMDPPEESSSVTAVVDDSSKVVTSSSWRCDDCKALTNDGVNERFDKMPPLYKARIGEVVWGRAGRGFGWWPALIYDPRFAVGVARTSARSRLTTKKNNKMMYLLYFFDVGFEDAAFKLEKSSQMKSWTEGLHQDFYQGKWAKEHSEERFCQFQKALSTAYKKVMADPDRYNKSSTQQQAPKVKEEEKKIPSSSKPKNPGNQTDPILNDDNDDKDGKDSKGESGNCDIDVLTDAVRDQKMTPAPSSPALNDKAKQFSKDDSQVAYNAQEEIEEVKAGRKVSPSLQLDKDKNHKRDEISTGREGENDNCDIDVLTNEVTNRKLKPGSPCPSMNDKSKESSKDDSKVLPNAEMEEVEVKVERKVLPSSQPDKHGSLELDDEVGIFKDNKGENDNGDVDVLTDVVRDQKMKPIPPSPSLDDRSKGSSKDDSHLASYSQEAEPPKKKARIGI